MSDAVRFGRPRVSRFAPPPRRRGTLPLPALVIGGVILLVTYGGRVFAPAGGPAPLAAAHVTDGDTLSSGTERIRLIGVDAPDMKQTCRDARGQNWACGLAARDRLAALIAQGTVACAPQGRDRDGRRLAVCSAGDIADLGRALVREGYAVSDIAGDRRYLAEENAARDAGRGLWRGAFERPSDWRRRQGDAG